MPLPAALAGIAGLGGAAMGGARAVGSALTGPMAKMLGGAGLGVAGLSGIEDAMRGGQPQGPSQFDPGAMLVAILNRGIPVDQAMLLLKQIMAGIQAPPGLQPPAASVAGTQLPAGPVGGGGPGGPQLGPAAPPPPQGALGMVNQMQQPGGAPGLGGPPPGAGGPISGNFTPPGMGGPPPPVNQGLPGAPMPAGPPTGPTSGQPLPMGPGGRPTVGAAAGGAGGFPSGPGAQDFEYNFAEQGRSLRNIVRDMGLDLNTPFGEHMAAFTAPGFAGALGSGEFATPGGLQGALQNQAQTGRSGQDPRVMLGMLGGEENLGRDLMAAAPGADPSQAFSSLDPTQALRMAYMESIKNNPEQLGSLYASVLGGSGDMSPTLANRYLAPYLAQLLGAKQDRASGAQGGNLGYLNSIFGY